MKLKLIMVIIIMNEWDNGEGEKRNNVKRRMWEEQKIQSILR
jgi:hypothetical protein